MSLDPKQQRFLDRFFGGLVSAIVQLGAGKFQARLPELKRKGDGIRWVGLHAYYELEDGFVVDIRVQLELAPGEAPYVPSDAPVDLKRWRFAYYSLDYCRKNASETTFRFDLNKNRGGHHVHIEPDVKDHVAAADAVPDTTDIDPRTFVAMVGEYRKNKIYPVKRKKP